MQRIKNELSRQLNISAGQLNEISLEDVELMDSARHDLHRAVSEMVAFKAFESAAGSAELDSETLMPCTSYWIEGSMDLVLYIWNEFLTKTIIVPQTQWGLRRDITVN